MVVEVSVLQGCLWMVTRDGPRGRMTRVGSPNHWTSGRDPSQVFTAAEAAAICLNWLRDAELPEGMHGERIPLTE